MTIIIMFFFSYYKQNQVGRYPPVPPGTGSQLPGDSRNFIPNRFDIPASKLLYNITKAKCAL